MRCGRSGERVARRPRNNRIDLTPPPRGGPLRGPRPLRRKASSERLQIPAPHLRALDEPMKSGRSRFLAAALAVGVCAAATVWHRGFHQGGDVDVDVEIERSSQVRESEATVAGSDTGSAVAEAGRLADVQTARNAPDVGAYRTSDVRHAPDSGAINTRPKPATKTGLTERPEESAGARFERLVHELCDAAQSACGASPEDFGSRVSVDRLNDGNAVVRVELVRTQQEGLEQCLRDALEGASIPGFPPRYGSGMVIGLGTMEGAPFGVESAEEISFEWISRIDGRDTRLPAQTLIGGPFSLAHQGVAIECQPFWFERPETIELSCSSVVWTDGSASDPVDQTVRLAAGESLELSLPGGSESLAVRFLGVRSRTPP